MKFTSSLKLKLIYVFRINDAAYNGCLKMGVNSLCRSRTNSSRSDFYSC